MTNLFTKNWLIVGIFLILSACNTPLSQEKTSQQSADSNVEKPSIPIDILQAMPINSIQADILLKSLKNPNPNLNYVGLAENNLPLIEIENLKKRFENLQQFGSYTGGRISHEFTQSDAYKLALRKQGNLANITQKLSFEPLAMNAALGNEFKLIGADYSGAFNNGKYNSLYRYYESTSKKRFEINEMYILPKGDTILATYKEAINFNLNGYPATLQKIKTIDNQEIYDLDFNVKNRSFSVSAEGFSYQEFIQVCIKITNLAEKNV